MENQIDTQSNLPGLTDESLGYLKTAGYWGKFLAIMGFIVSGVMVFAGIIVLISGFANSSYQGQMSFPMHLLGIFIILAGFYVFLSFFLLRFSNNAIETTKGLKTETLTVSLKNLKSLFKFMGVSIIVMLGLYVVGFLVGIVFALMY